MNAYTTYSPRASMPDAMRAKLTMITVRQNVDKAVQIFSIFNFSSHLQEQQMQAIC